MFLSMKSVFIFANSEDPDEMLLNATFHLDLYFLPKSLFTGIQNEKGCICFMVLSCAEI